MAKSFHTIISEGTIDVMHQGEEVTLELPAWLKSAKGILNDAEKLEAWAKDQGILHGLLHSGIQHEIIDIRAVARPATNAKTGETKSILAERDNAQDRVNKHSVNAVPEPGTSTASKAKKAEYDAYVNMARAMASTGLDEGTIKKALASSCDTLTVAKIMNEIAID